MRLFTDDDLGGVLSHFLHVRQQARADAALRPDVGPAATNRRPPPMSFLAPMMLAGLVLASAPIIIHLLNRTAVRPRRSAPMKYLKLTIKPIAGASGSNNGCSSPSARWPSSRLSSSSPSPRPVGSGMNLAGFLDVRGRQPCHRH
ncbi:MAG: hypothetical protein U0992_00575 [Planctomycetaceae bacterium]